MPPASEADLLNGALARIGAVRIVSIDDAVTTARWCKTLYPPLRRRAFSMHFWTFAEWRDQLAQVTPKPEFEFAFAYSLPADFIRIKEYNGALVDLSAVDPLYQFQITGRYKIEDQFLYTNDGEVKIVYTRDVENPARWSGFFFEFVKVYLASELCYAINKDDRKASALLQEALTVHLPMAAAVDSQQGTITPYRSDDLIWGR